MKDTLKAQRRAVRRAENKMDRADRRVARRRRVRCFWTRPFGHEFVNIGTDDELDMVCISCDQPRHVRKPHGHIMAKS